ncbi:aurora kinase A activator-like protein bora [Rhynchophorus ferrugineus]|uniref:aurora kinase A activator-like protein bora n=1 Tax=Rhynchophorus ferrugineus TaxID=354439 RepID=UPI003FCCE10C
MDFKHLTDKSDKHMTPKSEVRIFGKKISNAIVPTDSPFRNLPNFSTPPSRFAKIINPFDSHLIERLHLPTFSPNVFAQNSTPKTEQKFKWTIEDISSLKPADIDETTISQHVFSHDDPHIESVVQQKIESFFSEREIVPSPVIVKTNKVPLIEDCNTTEITPQKISLSRTCEGTTQTILSLPPVLPVELEEALKPYLTQSDSTEENHDNSLKNSSLYRKLFEFEDEPSELMQSMQDDVQSVISSPALSTGFSPLSFSPADKGFGSPFDMPELRDCNISPISKNSPQKTRLSRSACRLNFSTENMSVDASLLVPDIVNQSTNTCLERSTVSKESQSMSAEFCLESTVNWSMEYKQVSLCSPSTTESRMDVSNSNTPHSKLFTGQRKRLSESFKFEENESQYGQSSEVPTQNRNKIFRNDATDAGYYTQEFGECSNYSNVFASTPSKRNQQIDI